jgi:hypothetical protein
MQVDFVQDGGIEPLFLPDMTVHFAATVYILRVPHVKQIECAGERIILVWHTNQVDMVAHETVGPDIEGISFAVLLQPFPILEVILICLKDPLAVIAALRDMVGKSSRYRSRDPGHGKDISFEKLVLKKNRRCPYCEVRHLFT